MVVAKIQAKLKEVDEKVKTWVAAQPAHIEVALVTAASSLQGGFIGVLMGTFAPDMPTPPGPTGALTPDAQHAMKQMQALAGGPWIQARNFAVMTGVNAGISCAMRRIRNIPSDDIQTSMVSAMGSGMAFSLISGAGGGGAGPGGPNPVASAISTGIVFALFQGGFFQIGKMVSGGAAGRAADQMEYEQTSGMLRSLGLEKYEKNFKKGLLTDRTLPLLSDSALQEVKIPAGPRLMILDHIRKSRGEEDSWPEDAVPSEQ